MPGTEAKTICIHGGHIWTGGDMPAPVPGGLVIVGGRIDRLLAPGGVAAASAAADEVFDATGALVMPPLFDGHVHSTSTLLRGTENAVPLELWSYYAINYGRAFTERCVRAAIMLTAAEMIRNGIGGYIDHFPQTRFAHAALDAHRATGLRVGFAPFFADLADEDILGIPLDATIAQRLSPLAPSNVEAVRDLFVDLHARTRSDDRIRLLLGPNAPQRCSDRLWQLWLQLRDDLDLGSHTHVLETWPQARHAKERWPAGLVDELDRAGLLDARLSIAHAIWLTGEDRARLAGRGVTVVHNPMSNLMLGSGRFDVRAALDAGMALALGTDSSNTGGRHDLFEIMRLMVTAQRAPGSDFNRWVKPRDAVRAATEGIRAMGPRTGLGCLAVDGPADLLVVDFARDGLATAPVTLDALVAHADPRAVKALMVGGDWLLRDGRVEAFDEAAVVQDASACAADLRRAAQDAAGALAGLHQPYAGWHASVFGAGACPTCGI